MQRDTSTPTPGAGLGIACGLGAAPFCSPDAAVGVLAVVAVDAGVAVGVGAS